MKKRLLLIFPRSFAMSYGDMLFVRDLVGRAGLLGASLATVAALTPEGFDVEIVDENHQEVDFQGAWDLVGITGFHVQLARAGVIAERFRSRGIPVVCGGPSVAVSPERWRPFADVLIQGEAERIWPRFCRDFLAGSWKELYHETEPPELTLTPRPDFSLLSRKVVDRYYGGVVQTSRGCPFDCEFCDVVAYVGHRMRYKTPDQVLAEVRQMADLGMKMVVLADDNFTAGRSRSKEILRALKEFNQARRVPIPLATQLSIDAARDEELLELAAEAGLNRVLIGIESPNPESLEEVNKLHNVRSDMLADIRTFHEHGIMVMGTSIVGFDHDGPDVFERHLEFFNRAGVLSPQPFPLQAPDATPLKTRMEQEGRYLGWDTDLAPEDQNNFNTFTIQPRQMTLTQLEDGLHWLIRELYRDEHVLTRLERFFSHWESSPKRGRLAIPRPGLDLDTAGILARLTRYLALKARPGERALLKRMTAISLGSTHPQRLAFGISNFLQVLNTRYMLERLEQIRRERGRMG